MAKSKRTTQPPPPFNTASLQAGASSKLGIGVNAVMRTAQKLYEGVDVGGARVALITYMRTDGVHVSDEAVRDIRGYVSHAYGSSAAWLPTKPRKFAAKAANAQEAHEAIRPVDVSRTPEKLARAGLGGAELRLYELIWRQAVASQMAAAQHELLAVTVGGTLPETDDPGPDVADGASGRATARLSATRLVQPGFRAVLGGESDDDEAARAALNALKKNEPMDLRDVAEAQHFTAPPGRYSQVGHATHDAHA